MSDSEWSGDVHVLTVTSVTPPEGPFDDGEMEYEITHPPTCRQEMHGWAGHEYLDWSCDVAGMVGDCGLEFSLKYSGTPVTEPGTYKIQSWGRKYYVWDCGAYEYDSGIGLVDEQEAAS